MWFQTILLLAIIIHGSLQHGRMLEPPARNSMWRAGFNTKPDYDDSELFCGGIVDQWKRNKGKCGICGDSFSIRPPRPYETGGIYARNITVRNYRPGSEIDVILDLVANHMGTFEFSICPRNDFAHETEDCFIPLKVNGSDRYKIRSHRNGIFTMPVTLPRDINCQYCVFRWHWKSANNWGMCADGRQAIGCGPQETYRNCADIAVGYEYGIRGLNYEPPPSVVNGFDRMIMNNEIPKDNFITHHRVHWPGNQHHHNHHSHHHHVHHHPIEEESTTIDDSDFTIRTTELPIKIEE
uniref:Uncharacterized protein LOC113798077 n=2 Tax=Dermatophagoides pteronyssinus TaxID=6956 RepID=A0A6P6YHP2_DERPT|nr:uncharacterized protein LOC113798077 [Dermatophagoides pteronyssinus]